jgi:hypothetical protein
MKNKTTTSKQKNNHAQKQQDKSTKTHNEDEDEDANLAKNTRAGEDVDGTTQQRRGLHFSRINQCTSTMNKKER